MLFLWVFGVFLLVSGQAIADVDSPDALIKKVSDDVLTIVRQDKDIQNGNTKKAMDLVEAKVLPHFNFQHMTALAMGKDWRKATPEQKKRLSEEFKTLLVRTYSNRIDRLSRSDDSLQAGEDAVWRRGGKLVRTEIVQPGNKPIQLDYALEKLADGWKVFDVVVAGVSLVTNYRDTFSQEVRANGVDGLVQMLVAE